MQRLMKKDTWPENDKTILQLMKIDIDIRDAKNTSYNNNMKAITVVPVSPKFR